MNKISSTTVKKLSQSSYELSKKGTSYGIKHILSMACAFGEADSVKHDVLRNRIYTQLSKEYQYIMTLAQDRIWEKYGKRVHLGEDAFWDPLRDIFINSPEIVTCDSPAVNAKISNKLFKAWVKAFGDTINATDKDLDAKAIKAASKDTHGYPSRESMINTLIDKSSGTLSEALVFCRNIYKELDEPDMQITFLQGLSEGLTAEEDTVEAKMCIVRTAWESALNPEEKES